MRKALLVLAGAALLTWVGTASATVVFQDNFDSYANTAAFQAAWPGDTYVANTNGGLVISTAQAHSGTQSVNQTNEGTGRKSSHAITPTTPTDSTPLEWSFWFYDATGTGNLRQYCTLQDYAPASAQLLAIGTYNSGSNFVTHAAATVSQLNSYYSARLAFGTGAPGWFLLNGTGAPTRSIGWHEMKVVLKDTAVDFQIDGVSAIQGLSGAVGTFTATFAVASGLSWDHVTVGSGLSSANGGAFYDDVKIETTPEPATLAVLGLGSLLFVRRRRA